MNFEKPVFIIGCSNSGTKCLFYSLLRHRNLGGPLKEIHFYGIQPNIEGRINRLFSLYPCFHTNYLQSSYKPNTYDCGPISPDHVKTLITSIKKASSDKNYKKGSRLLIKDPKLSLRIKWLKECFPDCYIISIIRNPWSVVEGIKRKLAALGDTPMRMDTPTAMAQWINTNTIIDIDSKNINNFLQIRYEDMIQNPVCNIEDPSSFWFDILKFLGLSNMEFCMPNDYAYSKFVTDKDSFSASNLSSWDKDFIYESGKHLIEKFGYERI